MLADTLLVNILPVALASCLGVFLRIICAEIASIYAIPGPSFFLANMVGCFLIGQTLALSATLQSNLSLWITTGICGALTTFSGWQQYSASIVALDRNVPGWLMELLVGFSVWIASYYCGRHSAALGVIFHRITLAVILISGIIGAVLTRLTEKALIAIAFGALGGLVRYLLSHAFNKNVHGKYDWFPFGTFVSNIVGCIISGLTLIYSGDPYHPVIVGVAGALTTVSTFMAEIDNLQKSKQYIYGLSTIAVAQIILISIFTGLTNKA